MIKNKNPVIEMYEKQPFPNFGIKSDYITKVEEMRKNIFKGLNLFPQDIKNNYTCCWLWNWRNDFSICIYGSKRNICS